MLLSRISFPDTEEVTSSNLVTPTTNNEVNGLGGWPLFFGEQNREQNVSKTAPKLCSAVHSVTCSPPVERRGLRLFNEAVSRLDHARCRVAYPVRASAYRLCRTAHALSRAVQAIGALVHPISRTAYSMSRFAYRERRLAHPVAHTAYIASRLAYPVSRSA